MKERNFYWLIIGILIALNIAIIITTLWSRNTRQDRPPFGRRHQHAARSFLDDQLNLDSEQKQAFAELRKEHFSRVRQLKQGILNQKLILFENLNGKISQDSVESLAGQIAEKEKMIELATYRHFNQMRENLQPGQRQKFDSLMARIIKRGMNRPRFSPNRGKNNPPQ